MSKMSRITERTAEIKSSDGKQLGIVQEIAGNEIVISVYVGKKGLFMLPKDMIDRIRRKTVHLNLTKEEFEDWWRKEGHLHEAELPDRIDVALGKRLVGEDLELLREQVREAFDSTFIRDLSKKERDSLCLEQEEIRQSISANVRKKLRPDEWVFYLLDLYEKRPQLLSLDEDVFLVTSKRLIRFKSDGTKKDNWTMPLDGIIAVKSSHEYRSVITSGHRWPYRRVDRRKHKVLRFEYQRSKKVYEGELPIPIGAYVSSSKIRRIGKYLEKFTGLHVEEKASVIRQIIQKLTGLGV